MRRSLSIPSAEPSCLVRVGSLLRNSLSKSWNPSLTSYIPCIHDDSFPLKLLELKFFQPKFWGLSCIVIQDGIYNQRKTQSGKKAKTPLTVLTDRWHGPVCYGYGIAMKKTTRLSTKKSSGPANIHFTHQATHPEDRAVASHSWFMRAALNTNKFGFGIRNWMKENRFLSWKHMWITDCPWIHASKTPEVPCQPCQPTPEGTTWHSKLTWLHLVNPEKFFGWSANWRKQVLPVCPTHTQLKLIFILRETTRSL